MFNFIAGLWVYGPTLRLTHPRCMLLCAAVMASQSKAPNLWQYASYSSEGMGKIFYFKTLCLAYRAYIFDFFGEKAEIFQRPMSPAIYHTAGLTLFVPVFNSY